jgi:hypothetical protein
VAEDRHAVALRHRGDEPHAGDGQHLERQQLRVVGIERWRPVDARCRIPLALLALLVERDEPILAGVQRGGEHNVKRLPDRPCRVARTRVVLRTMGHPRWFVDYVSSGRVRQF